MLAYVPLRDQLDEPTWDGLPDVNRSANCVPSSLSAAVSAYIGRDVYGDELKDRVYGEAFRGGTNPYDYIPMLLKQYGVVMRAVESHEQAVLISTVKQQLLAHHPVSAAIPSQWNNLPLPNPVDCAGSTHEVTFCDWDQVHDTLTAMNPWPYEGGNHGVYQTMPTSWWQARLVYGRVFPLTYTGGAPVSTPYTQSKDAGGNAVLTYPAHNHAPIIVVSHAQADYVLTQGIVAWPLQTERYVGGSLGYIPWDSGRLTVWDAVAQTVREDRAGQVVAGICADADAAALRSAAALTAAQAELATLKAQLAAATAAIAAASGTPIATQALSDAYAHTIGAHKTLDTALAALAQPASLAQLLTTVTSLTPDADALDSALVALGTQVQAVVSAAAGTHPATAATPATATATATAQPVH